MSRLTIKCTAWLQFLCKLDALVTVVEYLCQFTTNSHKHMTETNTGRKFKHCIYLPQGIFSPFLSAALNMVQYTEKGSGTSSSTSGHADKMFHREKAWTGMQKPVISDTQCFQILKHNNKTYLFFPKAFAVLNQNVRN